MKNHISSELVKSVLMISRYFIMLVVLQTVFATLLSATETRGQGKSVYELDITLNHKEASLLDVFKDIENQSSFSFSYHSDVLSGDEKVTLSGKSNLGKTLESISKQTNLRFKRIDDNIHVAVRLEGEEAVEEKTIQKIQEEYEVTGQVTDENGEPMPGVTVQVKGTTVGTITDIDGKFKLKVKEEDVLIASFVGYKAREISLNGISELNIQMEVDITSLEEVVVVGYGSVKKSDLTGSVVKIKQEDITALPVTNALESLQGKVAGMDLTRTSGDAGSGMNIRIRGTRSISADNGPLILVDGMPYGNDLDIPPSEIESIEVLKDASSTAIYGSRGANGVILVTTKRGKSGQARITFNAFNGVNQIVGYPDFTLGQDWVEMRREAFKRIGQPLTFEDQQMLAANYELVQNNNEVDWRDIIFKDGAIQNYQVGASGGSDKTTYSLFADYIKETGIIRLDDYERYLIRATIDHKMNQWINLGTSIQYARTNDGKRGNPLNQANKQPPYGIPFNEDGSINYNPFGDPNIVSPIADEIPGAYFNESIKRRVLSNSYLKVSPLKWVTFKSSISFIYSDTRDGYFGARQSLSRSNQVSQAKYNSELFDSYQWENTLTFDKTYGPHSIQLVAGNAALKNTTEEYGIEALDISFDNMRFYNLSASDPTTRSVSSNFKQTQLLSYFGRLNYTLKDRYLVTLVLRADGASQLAPGNKWQSFPSAAVGWKVSEESFLQGQNGLSFLKLRGSYGLSGNSAVDAYQTDSRLGQSMYSWGETVPATGFYLRSIAAEDLGWETTSTFNIGADFGFLSDKFTLTIERYWMHTTDLLLEKKLPFATGYPFVTANVGETKNNGIEIILSSNNLSRQSPVKWNTDITFSANREKIVKLADSTTRDVINGWFVGHPIDVHWDYEKLGIWQLGEEEEAALYGNTIGPGEIKVRDVNGDTLFTDDDKIILGNPRPKWTLGVNNRVEFKGFDASVFVFARIGQMIHSELHSRFDRTGNGVSYKADYWTEENPTNAYPKPSLRSQNEAFSPTLGYKDGSFVKVRNITLGYTLPRSLTERAGMTKFRVYTTMKNFFTFSELTPYDPERGGRASSPMTKQWIVGLNVTF